MLRWIADPTIFTVGGFTVRWYALLFVVGMILSYRNGLKLTTTDKSSFHLTLKDADRLFIYVFLSGLVGARLGHVIFYEPNLYISDPLKIFKIWEGGLASHGGTAAVILAGIFYCRRYGVPFFWLADRVCISIALLAGFIRLGNLFNSEILGKPTLGPWAVIFSRVDQTPRHPAALYEALYYFAMFFILKNIFYKTNLKKRSGFLFGLFLAGIFIFRFFIEYLKENQVASEAGYLINLGQALSIPFVIAGIYLILRALKNPEIKTPDGLVPQ